MTESMSRAGSERMPQSDAADHSSSAIFAFTPIGPRITAEEVRAKRRGGGKNPSSARRGAGPGVDGFEDCGRFC